MLISTPLVSAGLVLTQVLVSAGVRGLGSPGSVLVTVDKCWLISWLWLSGIASQVQVSRCRPSLHNQSTLADDPLSPACFTEAVQHCATANHMAVRQLAACALAPLIPPEELAPMLLRLLTHVNGSRGSHGTSSNVVRPSSAAVHQCSMTWWCAVHKHEPDCLVFQPDL